MSNNRGFALILFAAAVACGILAWQHLQPYGGGEWLPLGVIVRGFVPVFGLLAISAWFWFRR